MIRRISWSHRKSVILTLPTNRIFSSLRDAEVLFSDNHVLIVNKPPGWHSMPNNEESDNSKCLVAHLRKRKLGGGSNKRFLTPLHRIDQPCSGVLMLGKTRRAAKRIQPEWSMVRKTYCVVVTPTLSASWDLMRLALSEEKAWRRLKGTMIGKNITKTSKGWSVAMEPGAVSGKGRTVQLDWSLVGKESDQPDDSSFVLFVRTNQGSRHMVRAVLASNGLPIQGDSRYGGKSPKPSFCCITCTEFASANVPVAGKP